MYCSPGKNVEYVFRRDATCTATLGPPKVNDGYVSWSILMQSMVVVFSKFGQTHTFFHVHL